MREQGQEEYGPLDAADTALNFEAMIVGLRGTKEGLNITLQLHPQEGCLPALFEAGVGQRLMVSAVAIGDNEEIAPPASVLEGVRAVRKAGILCANSEFQDFLVAQHGVEQRQPGKESEEAAKLFTRAWCRVRSRSDLKYDRAAQLRLDELVEEFTAWRRQRYLPPQEILDGLEL